MSMTSQTKYKTFLGPEQTDTSEDEADYILRNLFNKPKPTTNGYSIATAAIFITSYMAGMGVLSLPRALAGTGWYGMILISLACVNSCYSALLLGRSWIILEERWEEYRGKFRCPYPALGLRAAGPWMRYIVTATLNITLIGIAVVYILLSALTAQSITQSIFTLDYCYWIILLSAILCPFTWFGSLEDFWFAAIGALVTAVFVCYSLLVAVLLKMYETREVSYHNPTFSSFCLSFGTILFAFGGVFFFPTVQNDMTKKEGFSKAAVLGFTGLLLLYLPIAITGYAVLGSTVSPNILLDINPGYLRTSIEACLAGHLLLAFLLVLNPVQQEVEEALQIKASFNYKRCILRSLLILLVMITALAVPHFDKIMNFIGGSTITLLTFIYPPLFYICLKSGSKLEPSKK